MSQFTNTIKDVGRNYKKYDKWEQDQANKMAKKEYLVHNLGINEDKVELTIKRAKSVIRATEIMDTRSENNCENVEQIVGMMTMIPAIGLPLAQIPITNTLERHYNKNSKEIKDLFNKFEQSNPKKAKELQDFIAHKAKTFSHENIKETETKFVDDIFKLTEKNAKKAANIGLYGTMGLLFATAIGMILWGNSQQKQASRIGRFQAKQDELKDLKNFIVYTPEQLAEAEEIAKKIPDKKERNSISQAIHELKEMQRDRGAYKRWYKQKDPNELEKLKARDISPEELQKASEDKELITNIVSDVNIKAEEFSENLENAFDTFGTLSFLLAVPLGFGINKLLSLAKTGKKANMLASILVPAITTLGIQIAGTFEQKEASRIGRFYARKDLLNNPHKLMSFTTEEMAQAEHIKAPKQKKSFLQKIGDSFKFLKDYYKQKKEYKTYKEKTQKYNERLQEALKQIQTTEAQRAEAKTLQSNVFRAFDEVDEMSQRYSEDIEATTEIAKSTATNLFQLAWLGGVALLGAGIYKGNISLAKPIKKLSDICFKEESTLRQSITKLYEALQNNGKNGAKDFQKSLISGKMKDYFAKPENKKVETALNKVKEEFNKIFESGSSHIASGDKTKNFTEILETIFENHFKQTKISKWGRNLTIEAMKPKMKKSLNKEIEIAIENAKKEGNPLTKEQIAELNKKNKELQEFLGLNGLKNYKTTIWTGIIGGIPLLAPMFAVPYVFNAWLTDIQKKAGKIGVMKAMNRLDDPRIFAAEKQ